jgi:hypothetical protein
MKKVKFLSVTIFGLMIFLVLPSLVKAQEKKSLDAFISATTKSEIKSEPVPGAEITVEQVGGPVIIKSVGRDTGVVTTGKEMEIVGLGFEKKSKYYTNEKGEFTINLSSEQFNKFPKEMLLKFTIKPKDPTKYNSETNVVKVKVQKPQIPTLTFVVTFIKSDTKTNKGTFAVSSKAQT